MKTRNGLYCVYMHINKINGKRYVGITSKEPSERWGGRRGYGYYNNKHFMSAIKKYGWDSFEHIIVGERLYMNDACNLEKELIAKYNSNNPLFGYNICAGGETNILPQSSLDKISQKNKGRKMSDEAKKKRAKHPPKAVRVVCGGVEFVSITECVNSYGVSPKEMTNWVNGYGYMPEKFVELELRPKDLQVEYIPIYSKRKWVYCDNKEYESVCEFCRQEHIPCDTVRGWLCGKYRMPEKYVIRGLRKDYKKFYKIIIKEK